MVRLSAARILMEKQERMLKKQGDYTRYLVRTVHREIQSV